MGKNNLFLLLIKAFRGSTSAATRRLGNSHLVFHTVLKFEPSCRVGWKKSTICLRLDGPGISLEQLVKSWNKSSNQKLCFTPKKYFFATNIGTSHLFPRFTQLDGVARIFQPYATTGNQTHAGRISPSQGTTLRMLYWLSYRREALQIVRFCSDQWFKPMIVRLYLGIQLPRLDNVMTVLVVFKASSVS